MSLEHKVHAVPPEKSARARRNGREEMVGKNLRHIYDCVRVCLVSGSSMFNHICCTPKRDPIERCLHFGALFTLSSCWYTLWHRELFKLECVCVCMFMCMCVHLYGDGWFTFKLVQDIKYIVKTSH